MGKKYTRGNLAVLQIALATVATPDVLPLAANRRTLLETDSVGIGFGSRTIDFANFATGGSTVQIPAGKEPQLRVGDAQWVDDSLALQDMEKAGREDLEVWYIYYPTGVEANKGYYGKMNVSEWQLDQASAGLSIAKHSLNPIGLPTPFGFTHLADNVEPATVNPVTP